MTGKHKLRGLIARFAVAACLIVVGEVLLFTGSKALGFVSFAAGWIVVLVTIVMFGGSTGGEAQVTVLAVMAIILGSVGLYAAVGLRYARSQIHACVAKAENAWHSEDSRKESVNGQLAVRAIFWPVMALVDLIKVHLRKWLWRPHVEHVERVQRLRDDRRAWQQKTDDGTEDERRLAADIVAALDDILAREGRESKGYTGPGFRSLYDPAIVGDISKN